MSRTDLLAQGQTICRVDPNGEVGQLAGDTPIPGGGGSCGNPITHRVSVRNPDGPIVGACARHAEAWRLCRDFENTTIEPLAYVIDELPV